MTRREQAFDLLGRYVRTGARADGLVAADAFAEAGFPDVADDVLFSAENCRQARANLLRRVRDEVDGKVIIRTRLPSLDEHSAAGYAPPRREIVAVQHAAGGVTVWERVGFIVGPRRRFECAWRVWARYDVERYRRRIADLVETVELEVKLAEIGEDTLLVRLPEWLARVPNAELQRWRQLIIDRFVSVQNDERGGARAYTWLGRLNREAQRRGIV